MIGGRRRIVGMSVGRCPRQSDDLQAVILAVRSIVMLQCQMHTQPEDATAKRHPEGQDKDRDSA